MNYVSLLQILIAVDKAAHFTEAFEHFSVKHSKGKPSLETFFAGLVAQGCNIGVEKLAHTSKGILENTSKNTVKWYFSFKFRRQQTIIDHVGIAVRNKPLMPFQILL